MTYDYNDPAQAAVYLQLKSEVNALLDSGATETQDFYAIYTGVKLWGTENQQRLIWGHLFAEKQRRSEEARRLEKVEEAAKPTPAIRSVVRSQTIQGKAAATKRFKKAKSETERRWIPEFPGFKIDAKAHVYKPSGEEAAYRFNHKFQKCARLKNEDGEWRELNVYNLMVKSGFEESLQDKRARKNQTQYTGSRAWKSHYESQEEAVADGFLDESDVSEN